MISRDRISTTVMRNNDGSITVTGTLTLSTTAMVDSNHPDALYAVESAKHQVRNVILGEMYASLREPVDALWRNVIEKFGTSEATLELFNKFQALADIVNCRVMDTKRLKKYEPQG